MLNLGTVRPGSTIYIPFDSFASTGASATITGLLASDIEVYKDASMTQRASDNGYALLDTDGIDLDGITGIQGISIDLADNSTAGFYAAGSKYRVVISSVTIDGQTVNFTAAYFTIGYPDAVINTTIATLASQTSFTLTAGPAEDDALNDQWVIIHDVASAVQLGKAIILDYTGSTKTVTLVAGTTFTAAVTDNISIMAPTLLARLTAARAGYLDNLSAGAAALQSSLAALITTVGAAGAGLTAADDAVIAAIAAIHSQAIAEPVTYPAIGGALTVEKALFAILVHLHSLAYTGTTKSLKRWDNQAVEAMQYAIDDTDDPTLQTRTG